MYEKNRRSRVFAPLAEVYRKLGRIDDALVVLKEGIKNNPDYIMGHVALAACYHDCEQDQLAYGILRPLINKNRDNIRLQKLFAEVCTKLNHEEEALEVYKFLLFLNPKDYEIQGKVKDLENRETFQFLEEKSFSKEENLASGPFDDLDDWVQVDFMEGVNQEAEEEIGNEWTIGPTNIQEITKEEIPPVMLENNNRPSEFEPNNEKILTTSVEPKKSDVNNIVTLTLVDLYVSQGYYAKAKEILKSFEGVGPEIISKKIAEIEEIQESRKVIKNPIEKAQGHDVLSNILDKKLGQSESKKKQKHDNKELGKKFSQFLSGIHQRAKKQSSVQKS
ncbi:MAG: tetratricopeptide repeat protein [Halobacteriovoraceae bacterium]|nr:tetratricopeptide repeat protein [Halobacteriovoraceae bacterium]